MTVVSGKIFPIVSSDQVATSFPAGVHAFLLCLYMYRPCRISSIVIGCQVWVIVVSWPLSTLWGTP